MSAGAVDAPSPAREAAVAAVGLVVLVLVAYGAALGLEISNLHNGLLAVTSTAVGLYVLRMRPGHQVARLFVAVGLIGAVMFFGRQYALHDEPLPGADWLAWVSITAVPLVMALYGMAIMIFPTGRTLGPRWRAAAVVMVVLGVLLAVASALWPVEDDWRSGDYTFPFSTAGDDWARDVVWPLMNACYQGFLLLWVAAVVVRIRRAVGDGTRQLRWFTSAVALVAALTIGGMVTIGSPVPGLLATPLIPVAAGVAILKYRLYDIDPVINKTIVVGALALLVTAGYVAVVLGVGALLPVPDGVLALVATALVAVAFEPLRLRAQRLADRLVYGRRATPYEALSRLSQHLRDPQQELLAGLVATVAHAVGATRVVLLTGDERAMAPAAVWPADAAPEPTDLDGGDPHERVVPVEHRGAARGALLVRTKRGEPLAAGEERLLADLAAQVGLVLELRAAARRIVTAQDAARRQIERDLHDGAQQRLVTLGVELGGLAARAASAGDTDLAERAAAAREQLLEATAELREMARGLHPSVLTHDGLAPALGYLVDRAPIPVRLRVEVDRRLPPEVEATAYYLVSEAITNAARHSGADHVRVCAAVTPAGLGVEVADDGRGGADPGGAGSGLQGLCDRLAALGAVLDLDSPPGGGTRLRTVIPCE
jgi:signal transduction histidine kinase